MAIIYGTGGRVDGTESGDTIYGTSGVDYIYGNGGDDWLWGGGGDDIFYGGYGADNYYGEAGIDTVDFSHSSANWVISLMAGTAVAQGLTETLSSIENISGSGGNDYIYGNSGSNVLLGGSGNDHIWGYGGVDAISGGSGTDTVHFNFSYNINNISLNGSEIIVAGSGSNDIVQSDVEYFQFSNSTKSRQDIIDDLSQPSNAILSISTNNASRSEGDSGSRAFTFTVQRTGDMSQSVHVGWNIDYRDTNSSDFTGSNGGTVYFSPNETSETITVYVRGDTTVEPDEDFRVVLSNASYGAEIDVSSAWGEIRNDDTAPQVPTVSISGNPQVDEGGTLVFTVSQNGAANNQAVTIYYTVGGEATSGSDYTPPSGSVTIGAGYSYASIDISTLLDGFDDPDDNETVTITLSANSGYNISSSYSSATGTIVDTYQPPVQHDPTVTPHDIPHAQAGQSLALSDLFSWNDLDGDIVSFTIRDNSNGGGHLFRNNVQMADGDLHSIPANEIGLWTFVSGPAGSTDDIRFNAIDSRGAFNASVTATVSVDGQTVIADSFRNPLGDGSTSPTGFTMSFDFELENTDIGAGLYHLGEDWVSNDGSAGARVNSIANGRVVEVGNYSNPSVRPDSAFGRYAIVEHTPADGTKVYSLYAHMQTVSVVVGQDLTIGQQLGTIGSTGASGGSNHLHWEISYDNNFTVEGADGAWGYDLLSQTSFSNDRTVDPTDFVVSHGGAAPLTWTISPDAPTVNEDDGSITFIITRSSGEGAVTVYASTINGVDQGYADNINDYGEFSGVYNGLENREVVFQNGDTTGQFTIYVNDADANSEVNETFGIIVQSSSSHPISTHITDTTFTIQDTSTPADPLDDAEAIFANAGGQLAFLSSLASAAYHLRSASVLDGVSIPGEVEAYGFNDRHPNSDIIFNALSNNSGLHLLTASDLGIGNQSVNDPMFSIRGMINGIYTNENAAALVVRSGDALFVSFRGTNDAAGHLPYPLGMTPDREDWIGKSDHYQLFQELISAIDTYTANNDNGISHVYVSGHSLGAAMGQHFMETHSGNMYSATLFANPGYGGGFIYNDPRMINIYNEDDSIRLAQGIFGQIGGDDNTIHHGIEGVSGGDLHSMDLYYSIAQALGRVEISDNQTLDVDDLDGPLNGLDFDSIVLQAHMPIPNSSNAIGLGNDTLHGTNDADLIIGFAGQDDLYGGPAGYNLSDGSDFMLGGSENDTYHFFDESGHDSIFDSSGSSDSIYYHGNGSQNSSTGIGVSLNYIPDFNHIVGTNDLQIDFHNGTEIRVLDYFVNGHAIENFIDQDGSHIFNVHTGDVPEVTGHAQQSDYLVGTGAANYTIWGEGIGASYARALASIASDSATPQTDDWLFGAAGQDTLYGGWGNDVLMGNENVDHLEGGIGDDFLDGGTGADVLIGGDGTGDIASYAFAGSGVTVSLANGTGTRGEASGDTLTGIEYLIGSQFSDILFGDAGVNILLGQDGADYLDGGANGDAMAGGIGNDAYVVDNAADIVIEEAGEGTDTVETALTSYTLGSNVENLTFTGSGTHTGSGNGLDNAITGGTGDDHLFGMAGEDIINGGDGNDLLSGGAGSDQLNGGSGNDRLDGGSANPAEIDVLYGGTGNDTYIVNSTDSALDIVFEGGAFAGGVDDNDTIISEGSFFWDFYNVGEVLTIGDAAASGAVMFSGQGNSTMNGNDTNNFLLTYGSSNIVNPGAGTDVIGLSLYGLGAGMNGVNTVKLTPGDDTNYIYDFESGIDKVDVSAFSRFASGSQIVNFNLADTGWGSYIYLGMNEGEHEYLAFVGLHAANLDAGDFVV